MTLALDNERRRVNDMGTSSASLCWARERISSWPGVKQVLVEETTAKFRSGLGASYEFQ